MLGEPGRQIGDANLGLSTVKNAVFSTKRRSLLKIEKKDG